jgi:hypothetical protein
MHRFQVSIFDHLISSKIFLLLNKMSTLRKCHELLKQELVNARIILIFEVFWVWSCIDQHSFGLLDQNPREPN